MTNERKTREMASGAAVGTTSATTSSSSSSSVHYARAATNSDSSNKKQSQQQFIYKDESVGLGTISPLPQPLHVAAATSIAPAQFVDPNSEDLDHHRSKHNSSPFSKFFQNIYHNGTTATNGAAAANGSNAEPGKRKSSINALLESSCATLGLANGLVPPHRKASSSSTHLTCCASPPSPPPPSSSQTPSSSNFLFVNNDVSVANARQRSKSSSGAAMFCGINNNNNNNTSSSTMKQQQPLHAPSHKNDGTTTSSTTTTTTTTAATASAASSAQPPERAHKSRADSIIEALVTRRLKQERRRSVAALLDSRGSPTRKIADFHHQTHHQHQPQHHQHRSNSILPTSPGSSPPQKPESQVSPPKVAQHQTSSRTYSRQSVSHDPASVMPMAQNLHSRQNGNVPEEQQQVARFGATGAGNVLRENNSSSSSSSSSSSDDEGNSVQKKTSQTYVRNGNNGNSARPQIASGGKNGEDPNNNLCANTDVNSKGRSSSISALLTSSTAIATSPLRAVEDLDLTLQDSDRVIRRLSNDVQREFDVAMKQLRVSAASDADLIASNNNADFASSNRRQQSQPLLSVPTAAGETA